MKTFWTTILISALCISTGIAQPLLELKEVKKAPATLNSDKEEGLPLFVEGEGRLYFVRSLYSANVGGESAGQDIWTSLKQGDNWSEAVNSIGRLNNLFNNAVVGIADSGRTLYLNGTYSSKPEYQIGLTKSTFVNGSWTRPTAVRIAGFNPKESFYTFYVDEENGVMLLSFTQKRQNKEDLFVSFKKGGGWTKPQTLGADINTEGAEFAPFLSEDGQVLYFSSNGHPGKGEVDIYYSRRRDESWRNWSKPVNLGDQINSPAFDAYFSLYGTQAFFASNRDGGFADLYIASYEARVQEQIEEPEMTDAKIYEEGTVNLEGVVSAENIDALESIDIYDDNGDLVESIEPDEEGHFQITDLNSFSEYHLDLNTLEELLGETELYIINHDGSKVYLNKNLITGQFDFETLEEDVKDVQIAEVIDESELVTTHFKADFDFSNLDPDQVTMVLTDEFDHVLEEVKLNPDGTFDFKKIQKGHLYSIDAMSEEDVSGNLYLLEGDEEKLLDADILGGALFEKAKGVLSIADAMRIEELKGLAIDGGLYAENLEGVQSIDVYDELGRLHRSFTPNEEGEFELEGLDKFSKYSIDLRALDRTSKNAKIFILNEDGEKVYLNKNLLTGKFPFETLEEDVKALALEDISEDPPLTLVQFQAEFDTSQVSPEDVAVYLKDEYDDIVEAVEMQADGSFDLKRIREGRLYKMTTTTPEAFSGEVYAVDQNFKIPLPKGILEGEFFEKTADGELSVADETRIAELKRVAVDGTVVAENAKFIESIDVYDKQGKLFKTFVPNDEGEFELKGLDQFSKYDLDLRALGKSLGDANIYITNVDGEKIYLNKNLLTGKFPFETLKEDVDALEVEEFADESRFVTTHFRAQLGRDYKEGDDVEIYLNDEFDDLVEVAHINPDGSFDFKKIEEGHLYWISTSNPGALEGKLYLVEDGKEYILNASILKGALFEKFSDGHLAIADADHHTEVAEAVEGGEEVEFKFKYGNLPSEGSKIDLYDEEGHVIDEALTDAKGGFKFTKLGKDQDYRMGFDDGIDVSSGLGLFIVDNGKEMPVAQEILAGKPFNSDAMLMDPVMANEEAFKFDESNLPPVGTKVYLEDEEIDEVVDSSYVDSEGNFKFAQLTPRKDYAIKLASAVDNTAGLDFFIIDATGDKIALDEEGKTSGEIIGKVEAETTEEFQFDPDALPPEGTVVYLTDENDQIIDSAEVDESGEFRLNNLRPDERYNIRIAEVDETAGLSEFFIVDATGEKVGVSDKATGQEFIGRAKSARTDKYKFDFKNLPAEGSKVYLIDDLGVVRDSAEVDGGGQFRFSKLAAEEGFFVQLLEEDGTYADMSTYRVENSKGKYVSTSFSKMAAEKAAYQELTETEKLALFDVFRFDARTLPPVGTKMVVTDVHGHKLDSAYVDNKGEFYFAKLTGDKTYLIDIDESTGLNIDKAIMFHQIYGDERKLFRLGDAFGYRPIDFVEVEETTFDFDKFVIETKEVIPEKSRVYLVEEETHSRVDSTEIAEDGSFGFKAMDRTKNYSMEFDEKSGIQMEEVELFSVSEEEDEIVEKVKIETQVQDEESGRSAFTIQPLALVEPEPVQMDAQIVAKYGLPELFLFAEEPVLDESFEEEESLKMIKDLEEAGQFEYADAVELFLEAQELRELAESSMEDDIVMAEPYDLGTPEDKVDGGERNTIAETIFEESKEEIDPRVGTASEDDSEEIVTAPLEEVPREDFEMNAETTGEEVTQGTSTTQKVDRPEDSGTASDQSGQSGDTGGAVAGTGTGSQTGQTSGSGTETGGSSGTQTGTGSGSTTGNSSGSGVASSGSGQTSKTAQPVMEDDAPKTKMATAVMDDSDWRIGDQIMAVEETERGWDVHFDFNKFLLNQGQIDYLYQVVIPMLKNNPELELTFEGHTDSRGSEEVNYRMAVLRISNVLYHIEMAGVEDTRLKVVPKGESDPIGDNNTAEGRAKNRRVEIIKME